MEREGAPIAAAACPGLAGDGAGERCDAVRLLAVNGAVGAAQPSVPVQLLAE